MSSTDGLEAFAGLEAFFLPWLRARIGRLEQSIAATGISQPTRRTMRRKVRLSRTGHGICDGERSAPALPRTGDKPKVDLQTQQLNIGFVILSPAKNPE